MFPMKLVEYWSHAFWVTISETKVKSFCKSVQEHCREGEKEKTERRLQSFLRYTKLQQEVGDDLGVCVLNLLPKVSTLTSLEALSLVKTEI